MKQLNNTISDYSNLRSALRQFLLVTVSAFFTYSTAYSATGNYLATPPFVAENNGKPNVIIALDISGSMKAVAYRDTGAGNWKSGLHDDFDPAKSYFGYFDSASKYTYDVAKGFFVANASGDWDGNFMNWLAMRRIDVARKVLIGGKVRDRNGETFGADTYYVLQGQNEPYDYSFRKSYSNGSAYTPFPDDQEFVIADGQIKPAVSANTATVPLSAEMEVGRVTMDWTVGDSWLDVEFKNTYTNPIVVAHSISYNGGDPTVARVKDVGAAIGPNGGFRIRLQEWEYIGSSDINKLNHTTEDIIYIVAEEGAHTIAMDGGGNLEFVAGKKLATNVVTGVTANFSPVSISPAMSATPAVFTGVSTYNEVNAESDAVTTRIQNVSASGFDVAMQEQEANAQTHVLEDIHYIAIVPITGKTSVDGIPVEVGTTGTVVEDSWYTLNFTTTFPEPPMVALNMQTFDGYNTASLRYGNAVHTESAVDIQLDEEKSLDNETDHVAENVAYFAVPGNGLNILVGVTDEPTGIIQDNTGGMRFGLIVYNYDHTKSTSSLYNGNTVDGGTFYPCYPDMSLPLASRTNYDICLETHVKSPISNVIDVIEDHPLIWGTTPIAETLYEIYGYVAQKNNARNGHVYYYDNGTETDHPGLYPSYKISNDWDPYYYDEYSAKLPCAKTFVLHFNDGAPYRDWDNTNPSSIGATSPISDGVGSTAAQQMLDDVAYAIRKNDCRGDIAEHQEIISYYVFAALGEGEINNNDTKRMRESAANGGFVDEDGDNVPDPAHPADFKTYYAQYLNDPTFRCTTNEWDDDGDCSPDTFYFANDGYELVAELNAAFQSILRRASSGGAASVISASSSGEGAIFQAIFQTSFINGAYDVKWTGDVHGLFVDDAGLLREDDGDSVLEDPTIDKIIDMCFDSGEQFVRVKLSTSVETQPTEAQKQACSSAIFSKTLFDINYLWSGGNWLAGLTNAQATAQRTYTALTPGRHILTAIDSSDAGTDIDQSSEVVDFIPSTFTDAKAGLLQAADAAEAAKIVNFIRGEDQAGYRSRQYSSTGTWRLGDVVYATPTTVGRPAESFDLLYNDADYGVFRKKYNDRRQVVYAGSNDGMLHAFNAGWYDAANNKFEKGVAGDLQFDLGAELWAYVPYNVLPHLKYITDPGYGITSGDHVYFVDLKPRIFDAKIFPDDSATTNIHPGGWGTILVGGMRLGGGAITVDADTTATVDTRTLRSSYFILDITDPDQPPKVLLEFTHADLGFTTAIPAPFVHDGTYYLMLGSGPDNSATGIQDVKSTQNGKLFLLNLNDMMDPTKSALDANFGTSGVLTLSAAADSNSFVSDLIAVDYDLDFSSDAIYFGTVAGTPGSWTGQLYRIQTELAGGTLLSPAAWTANLLYNTGLPITARPAIAIDKFQNRWILAGTGRFLSRADATDSSSQKFFGIKEPRNSSGTFTWGTASTSNLVNVTNAVVEENTAALSGVTLTPSLPTDPTFSDLQDRFTDFSANYLDGWYRSLSPGGNRVIGEATILGGTLTHTLYEPASSACTVDGVSQLSVTHFTTGTASSTAIIGTKSSTGPNGDPIIETIIDVGVAPALTPSLHTGSGYDSAGGTKAFIQTSTGKIISVEQENTDPVRSGEKSWRQLK